MTSRGRGDGDQPPRPESSELPDDPLLRPASNAGWDDEHPSSPRTPAGTATSGTAAAGIEKSPSTTGATAPSTTGATAPSTTGATAPSTTGATAPSTTSATAPSTTGATAPSSTRTAPARSASTTPPSTTGAAPSTSTGTAPARTASATPPSPTGATPPTTTRTASARTASATSPTPAGEEPLLPAAYHENDLRSAVGASPLSAPLATSRTRRETASARRHADDDESPHEPRSRKTIAVAAISITAGLAVAALVFLGHANSDRYLLTCEAERAVVEQGRSFPPWGTRALAGEAWRPLKITPETRCQPHETDDPLDLERLYVSMILEQATALLTAREVTKLDDAEALLKQALLLTRPPEHEPATLATERNEHHTEIERMLGDVTYWRATAKLHDAQAALADAAKQFDSAAAQKPRHVSDAAAWAAYARRLAQELHAGPAGAATLVIPPAASPASPTGSATEHPNVPAGVALPVEPAKGSADAPLVAPVAPVTPDPPVPPAPADAGVPTGGVLL